MEARIRRKITIAFAVVLLAAAGGLVFFVRAPALLVTDASFTALYGALRGRQRQLVTSLVLFRRVKPVVVSDSAGPDVVLLALEGAASRPFCVLFPYRYSDAALRFAGEFPEIRAAVLESYPSGIAGQGNFSVFRTERETDMYRAGLCAGILNAGGRNSAEPAEGQAESETPAEPGKIAFFQDRFVTQVEREAFTRGLQERGVEITPLFLSSASQLNDTRGLSCTVLTGGGAEYPDKNLKTPLIAFTWLDPAFAPRETALIFDDSVWALALPAFKMAGRKLIEGTIPSKVLFFPANIADNEIIRNLRKAVEKKF